MRKVYNTKMKMKIVGLAAQHMEDVYGHNIHWSWAEVLNNTEVYAVRVKNDNVCLMFKNGASTMNFTVTKDFARTYFEVVGPVQDYEGLKFQEHVNKYSHLY